VSSVAAVAAAEDGIGNSCAATFIPAQKDALLAHTIVTSTIKPFFRLEDGFFSFWCLGAARFFAICVLFPLFVVCHAAATPKEYGCDRSRSSESFWTDCVAGVPLLTSPAIKIHHFAISCNRIILKSRIFMIFVLKKPTHSHNGKYMGFYSTI
jgi:hypothetical protein